MSTQQISVSKALELIAKGESVEAYEVTVTSDIDAVDAFQLRKNGVSVPDDLITYNDEDLEYDEAFDEGEWAPLNKKVDEEKYIDVTLVVNDDIKSWINDNDIELDKLLNLLLSTYYQTDQLVHKK